MQALLDVDPFPTDGIQYRFVDIETGRPMPSPMDPSGRMLMIDVCWHLVGELGELADELRDNIDATLATWSREQGIGSNAYVYEFDQVDLRAGNPWFLHVQFLEERGAPLLSTRERLRAFASTLSIQLEDFERQLGRRGVNAQRATRQYWKQVCCLDFRAPGNAGR